MVPNFGLATRRKLLLIGAAALIYSGLWFLTHQFGAPQVRAIAAAAMQHSPYYTEAPLPTNRFSGRSYWCSTRAYAPFLVYADYGWQDRPLYGDGGSVLYFWFFGRTFRIRELEHWAS